ncbi:MAG: CopD family protein [Bryobacteraceae bacterium]
MPDPAVVLEASAKALLYASLLVGIGASAARWLLLRRAIAELGADLVPAIEQSVARIALGAASLALAACGLRVWTHTVAAFGFDGARSWDTLRLIALHSRWGQSWGIQFIAALVFMAACAATVWRRTFWPLATLSVVGFTATIPLLGHASGDTARMAVHALHILAAGVWLGTLSAVLLISVPPASFGPMGTPLTSRRMRLLILRRFSPIALPSAATVVAAGLVASWFYVGAVSNLWTTAYGRLLVLKAGLVVGISACGYVNWRHVRKLHEKSASSASIVVLEATLAAAVAIVTGYLTEIGHP